MAVVIDTLLGKPGAARHPEKAHRPDQPSLRKPDWIRVKAPVSPGYVETARIVRANGLHTVCEEAGCPNIGECWEKKHATFMIMGDTCTRACAFCNVKTGLPGALDAAEPDHVAEATAKLGLSHIVITSVDRDDLPDGGAAHFAAVITAIRARCPQTTIEVLTPDFLRKDGAAEVVVAARPDVFNHNLETVPSKYLNVRPGDGGPTCSTTISKPCRRNISLCGRARATSPRSGCCSRSKSSTRTCSPNPGSWSGSARSATKCSR